MKVVLSERRHVVIEHVTGTEMSFSEQDIKEFKTEALELLDVAERSLLSLDDGEDFRSCFDAIFRSFHNLKGAAGMMEMLPLQAHMHELENLLMRFKDASILPKKYVTCLLKGADCARALLMGESVDISWTPEAVETESPVEEPAAPVESSPTPRSEALEEFCAEGEEIVDRLSANLRGIEAGKCHASSVVQMYRDVHSLKGGAYLFGYQQLGDLAHTMESTLEILRTAGDKPATNQIEILYLGIAILERGLQLVKSGGNDEVLKPELEEFRAKMAGKSHPRAQSQAGAPQPTAVKEAAKEKEGESGGSIRVPVALLDNLMTLMGEMVLVRNQVLQFSSRWDNFEFNNLSKRLNVVTSEIQGEMMKTRMQPVGTILTKFHRVVRDLSNELGKQITLNLSGAETELDKSLLEAVKDPLTHIVRNSCDHGIEMPEQRRKSGKSESGTIEVRAYHEGGQVVIEVADDGKGLHKEVLLKKSIEKGLITAAQGAAMAEKDILNLIFAPGFSTAASVTNISGRGVGMDVVRTNIEKIGGSVDLSSHAGSGTTIKLRIPLTLAIIPALIVKCQEGSFAIPQARLEELVRVEDKSGQQGVESLQGTLVYRLRGKILPLVRLSQTLGLAQEQSLPDVFTIAVVNGDQGQFGLVVDEIQDTGDIVVKPINRLLKSLLVYSGATILGDGSIALILDVNGIGRLSMQTAEKPKEVEADERDQADRENATIQDFLIVRLKSPTRHAIVLGYVHRLEEFEASRVEWSGAQRVIRYGQTILPILSLNEMLGYGSTKLVPREAIENELLPIVVIQKAGRLFGLEVDEIVDTLSTSVEMEAGLVKQAGIYGCLNLENGLAVAIDPYDLIERAFPDSMVTPVSREENDDHEAAHEPTFRDELRILVAEDTTFFRRAFSDVLKRAGHRVDFAVDGIEALEALEKDPASYDLLISDIEMPRMNGFDLAKSVRERSHLAHLPMMAVSSRADAASSEKGIESGFDVYLEKLKPEVLLRMVRKLGKPSRRSA